MSIDELERLTDGHVVARRNMQLGIWAGMRLGLRGERLAAYARDVMDADYLVPGPYDVMRKIAIDFEEAGVDYPADMIVHELKRIERQVRREFSATD